MKCWHCDTQLIWNSDHDLEDFKHIMQEYSMVTYLTCPKCESFVEVYLPKEKENER